MVLIVKVAAIVKLFHIVNPPVLVLMDGEEQIVINVTCPFGYFGYRCQYQCHCQDNSKCDKKDGRCSDGKCEKRYTGKNCQTKCPFNRYGADCKGGCHCKTLSHCKSYCTCANGWRGTDCNEPCRFGYFGNQCRYQCHCQDNSKCDKKDGQCSNGICEKGYTGENCLTKCPHNRYGINCQSECHCRTLSYCEDNTCFCSDGWKGTGCNERCPFGYFGDQCRYKCHCQDNFKCNNEDGRCSDGMCEKGYTGDNCTIECPVGKFGSGCSSICHCDDNSLCNSADGTCSQGKCEKGYKGDNCQINAKGRGRYIGEEECNGGFFGDGCGLKCHCVDNLQCHHVDGKCPDGKCAILYKGDNCEKVNLDLILPLVFGIILVIITIVAVLFFRKKIFMRGNKNIKERSSNNINLEPVVNQGQLYENLGQENSNENIYQNTLVLTKDNFLSYFQQCQMEEEPFSDEFLKLGGNYGQSTEIAKLPQNINKNRYKSFLAYDHSRVVLSKDEISNSDYINANYIYAKDNYIATQGPLESTIIDFWRMVWQEQCQTIVMLANIIETGKVKCCMYWPDVNETENHQIFQISCIQKRQYKTYSYRTLTIKKCSTQEERTVHHLQYTFWPDHGVPKDPLYFIEFRNRVRQLPSSKSPIVVHCSAGVGRTGTFIALDILLEQLWSQPNIDVYSCVSELRKQRKSMVQNKYQYKFIYDVLAEEILTGFSEIPVNSISEEFKKLRTRKSNNNNSKLKKQFEDFLSPLNRSDSMKSYQEPIYNNILTNGFNQGLIYNNSFQNSEFTPKHKDFQEPIFVDGYYMENEMILTNHPREQTAESFWRLIYSKKCSVIVMIEHSSNGSMVYWPKIRKSPQTYGSINVELISVTEKEIYFERHFKVSSTKESTLGPVSVVQLQLKIWQNQQFPLPSNLIDIIQTVTNFCENKKQILLQCKDGITKSGLFAVLCVLISTMKTQEQLSILRLVRSLKLKIPQIIPDFKEYEFCWAIADLFQKEFSIYSN